MLEQSTKRQNTITGNYGAGVEIDLGGILET